MSLQPSPHSRHKNIDNSQWHELLIFAELLSTQSGLEAQLSYAARILERVFSCKSRIWLAAPFSDLLRYEGLQINDSLVSDLSPFMEQALREKQIIPGIGSASRDKDTPSTIAIPLLIKDEVLGTIQLDRKDQAGFTNEDVELINGYGIHISVALNYLRQNALSVKLQQHNDQLSWITEISQSILSNLNRDNLINSVISLLHQKFGFSKVNILIAQDDDKKVLTQLGISEEGIEPPKIFYSEKENGPIVWSISKLEPIVINDLKLHNGFPISNLKENIRSELVLPLIHGDLFIGVLDLCSNSANAFEPGTIKIFQLLAENIAISIRNANLYQFEQMRRLISDRLQDVVGSLTADVSMDDTLQRILDETMEFIPWDASAIWLTDTSANYPEKDQYIPSLRLLAARINGKLNDDDKSQPVDKIQIFDEFFLNTTDSNDLLVNYPWIAEVIHTKTAGLRTSGSINEPIGSVLGLTSDYSAIVVPLFIKNNLVGIIDLVHHLPDQYNGESISLAKAIATHVSIAIENTRLFTAAHDQAWITTVLLQVAEATQSITNLDELLETTTGMLPGLIGVDACMIFLWDQSIDAFSSRASNGFDNEQLARLNAWDIYPGSVLAFDKIKQSRIPVILNSDTISDEIAANVFPNYDFQQDLLILFPLITQDCLCGAILLDFSNSNLSSNSSQEVWDEQYTLIQGITHQAAIAIENLRLVKSQEEEAYISVALLQVAQAIVSLKRLDEILGSIVRVTPILVGVKRCIIYLWDEKDLVFRQSENFGFTKNDLSLTGQVFKANEFPFIETIKRTDHIIYHSLGPTNSPLSWNEIGPDDYHLIEGNNQEANEDLSINLGDRSLISRERLLIGFPLSVKGEILGVMLIEEEDPIKGSRSLHIREKRIEIIKGITQQAAIAIKNELLQREAVKSERMERELQLAREIQATFLPDTLPELTGWDIDVRWQPARQVGGDFYDFLILDENRIGFVIADVADKGMPAALFMTLIRTLIRAAAKEKSSPAAVLEQVNELLIPDSKHGMFVTVFYGIFYLNSGKIVYANAGHNPPIVKHLNQGELVQLTRTSIALGLFSDIEIEEREVSLNPGDWLLLYTDGISEAFSLQGEMFGTQRIFDLLSNHNFISSIRLLDLIEATVNEFIKGTDLLDDMTLAAIYRKIP